ncbi:putative integrase [Sphingobium herbicidovorans NBRC 16415]|jgi:integrase|uniref:Integrase n=1 Tax=Sphingobium herbicidovorans (strain ATCC 700291 / DSM 11019 / CCUG 56400 / KCTC 2939 / LMG 18315 / NBRC 16415 / MH) TaxID=1219045 RepID=A0A086P9G3_SPHHM|nr:site-specific integrase [Sphingobium herbicidovorans]KFG90031.1 putative integrase [Sphingobium herbicidovorans NBRC 16415]
MTSIRRRTWPTPSGEEKTAWQVDYRDAAGKRRSKQFARKKDAEAWLTTAAYQVQQGTHTPDSQSITIAKAAELWIKRGERENLEASTLAAYGQHVRLHIVPMCGDKKLSQINRPMAEGWRDQLMEKLSRPMAMRVLRSLSAIISEAQSRGYVAQNVVAGVKVRRAKREKTKVVIPTKAELKAVIETAKASAEPMAHPLALILIFAGLRASELRGLPWRCIDLKAATVTVDQRADLKNVIGPPKSEAGYRTIPLPSSAIAALKVWKLACPASEAGLVFPSLAKKAMSHQYMNINVMGAVQLAAGLAEPVLGDDAKPKLDKEQRPVIAQRYTLHDFRHAAASLWIEQRVNPKKVQRWMGHSSIQVTFDTYGHLFDQADQDAAVAAAIERELNETTASAPGTAGAGQ